METVRLLEDQRIRERLFDVISQFPVLYQSRQGMGIKILNPFASIEKVVREHINPLSLFLNDLVEEIRAGMTYFEAIDLAVNFAMKHRHRDRICEAVKELERIESKKTYFLNGLARYLEEKGVEERAERLRHFHKALHGMNQKYSKAFGHQGALDLIPWRVSFAEGKDGVIDGTYRCPAAHQLDLFKRAFLALSDLLGREEVHRWFRGRLRKEILEDMASLADLLFDYGYSAREIAGRLAQERPDVPRFLNDRLMGFLERDFSMLDDVKAVSRHIHWLSLLDYPSMVPFRNLYCRLSDARGVEATAREIERQLHVKTCDFRRIARLYRNYREARKPVLAYYLDFKFSRAFGDYFKPKAEDGFGAELTKHFVLRYLDTERVERKADQEFVLYSSKGKEEMVGLLKLFIDSLSHPERFRGERLHVLGNIQSGAMGKVLIGILDGGIVALKEPKEVEGGSWRNAFRLLEYEGSVHRHVQSERKQHENIVECFGMVEVGERRMLALGYHPADHLLHLIRKNIEHGSKGEPEGKGPLSLGTLKVIIDQMVKALLHLLGKGVVHRDIKPPNILYLLNTEGEIGLIKIIDFGVALSKAPGFPPDPFSGQIVGTLGYMAPEQVQRQADHPSDLYSFGAVLYQILSGRLPVTFGRARNKEELKGELVRSMTERRTPLLEANPRLRSQKPLVHLAELVDRMLLLDPSERISCQALSRELDGFWKSLHEEDLRIPILYGTS